MGWTPEELFKDGTAGEWFDGHTTRYFKGGRLVRTETARKPEASTDDPAMR